MDVGFTGQQEQAGLTLFFVLFFLNQEHKVRFFFFFFPTLRAQEHT